MPSKIKKSFFSLDAFDYIVLGIAVAALIVAFTHKHVPPHKASENAPKGPHKAHVEKAP